MARPPKGDATARRKAGDAPTARTAETGGSGSLRLGDVDGDAPPEAGARWSKDADEGVTAMSAAAASVKSECEMLADARDAADAIAAAAVALMTLSDAKDAAARGV